MISFRLLPKNLLFSLVVITVFVSILVFAESAEAGCSEGWRCKDNYNQGYQFNDCSWWDQTIPCSNGCDSGTGFCKPKPELVSIEYPTEMFSDEEATITIWYRNSFGVTNNAYISPSFSNDWTITDYSGGLSNKQLYPKGYYPITYKDSAQKTAEYPLIDFSGSWNGDSTKKFTIKLRPKTTGTLWFDVRSAFCDSNWNCLRDPASGSADQQGWNVYFKTINVKQRQSCSADYKCKDNYNQGYQFSDCSWWDQTIPCSNGCDSGTGFCKPTPEFVSVDVPSEIDSDGTATVKIIYRNPFGVTQKGYISPSFPGWDVVDYSVDGLDKKLYSKGDWVTTVSGSKQAGYPLIDFWGTWGGGDQHTATIRIKPKAGNEGKDLSVNIRAAFCDSDWNCLRDPNSGTADQQGYSVRQKTVRVRNPTFTITAKTNIEYSDIYLDNSYKCQTRKNWFWETPWCQFTANSGDHKLKAAKSGYVQQEKAIALNSNQEIYFELNEQTYTATITTNTNPVDIFSGSVWKCTAGGNNKCEISGLSGTVTLSARKLGFQEKSVSVNPSNPEADFPLTQLFRITSFTPLKNTVEKDQQFTVRTKVTNPYMTDLGWGNKEAKVKVTVSVDGQSYTKEETNNCNLFTCFFSGIYQYLTGGWEISQEISIHTVSATVLSQKTVNAVAQDVYAGTSDSSSFQITVTDSQPKATISTNIQADIYLDSSKTCSSVWTCQINVDKGQHVFTAKPIDPKYQESSRAVDIQGSTSIDFELAQLSYTITAKSNLVGTGIYIGQTRMCTTSQSAKLGQGISCSFTVPAGTYFVEAKKGGFSTDSGFVSGPPDKTVEFSLVQSAYMLTINTNTDGVLVSTNSGQSCTTLSGSCQLNLLAGAYTITGTKDGWAQDQKGVNIPDINQISLNLVKQSIQILSASIQSATYKKCGMEGPINESKWVCNDFIENNPTEIYGNSKIKLTYTLAHAGRGNGQYWNIQTNILGKDEFHQGTGDPTITEEIDIPRETNLDNLEIKVYDLQDCITIFCKEASKSIPVKIRPNPKPEIREVKMCYKLPQDNGACQNPVPFQIKTPGSEKILEFGPVQKSRPVALYFRLHNLENKGTASSYTILELDKDTLNAHNKLVNAISATRETDADYPGYIPIIWVFNSSSPGTHSINIKTVDLQDGDSSESILDQNNYPIKIQIAIHQPTSRETNWPFQMKGGYSSELKESIQSLDQIESSIKTIFPTLTDQEDKDYAFGQLSQTTAIQSLLTARQAGVVNSGTFEPIADVFSRIGQAATGFFSWIGNGVWNGLNSAWGFLNDFYRDPPGTLGKIWDQISQHPVETMESVLAVAGIAMLVVGIVFGFGIIPAIATIAFDIAITATIFAKVAIEHKPLDAFDLITLATVGLVNAGPIARAIKPVIKDSRLLKIQGDLDANIARLGEGAGRAKIQKEIGKLKITPGTQGKMQSIIDDLSLTLKKLSAEDISKILVTDLKAAKEIAEYTMRLKFPVKIVPELLSQKQALFVKRSLNYLNSAQDELKLLTTKTFKLPDGAELKFFAEDIKGVKFDSLEVGVFGRNTEGILYINTEEHTLEVLERSFFSDPKLHPWETTHHEVLHSVKEARVYKNGKLIETIDFDSKVKTLLGNKASPIPGKYTVFENQAHDLLTLKLMGKTIDKARMDLYTKAYTELVEARDIVKALKSGNITQIESLISTSRSKAFAAEWLAVKGDEAKNIIQGLKNNVKDKNILDSITEIEDLADVYKTKVMTIV